MNIRTKGRTALGPAALTSVGMAAEAGKGATVVICTDGLSNVGIGNLSDMQSGTTTQDETDTFYESLANYANENGVSVNLISIKGEECDLETLMTLSERTGGNVNIIDPKNAGAEFSNIANAATIATKVTVKVLLHNALEFRYEKAGDLDLKKNMLTKNLGNVVADTEVTFSYKLKEPEELKKIEGFDIEKFQEIPFQSIIEYTKMDGMKCIRTITKVLSVSDNEEEVKQDADLGILAVNAAQQASNLARAGQFREAQAFSMNNKKFFKHNVRNTDDQKYYKNWKKQMNEVYGQFHEQNNMEEIVQLAPAKDAVMSTNQKQKGAKRGFFSKMNDALSSNIVKNSRFTTKNLM